MYRFWILSLLVTWTFLLFGQDVNTKFETANQAFVNKNYKEAIAAYESLLLQGFVASELYYNLGNAYYKDGAIGKAVLYYERALRLKPNDKDTRHNLELIQNQLQDELPAVPTFFLIQWWQSLYRLFSATVWSGLTIALVWLAGAGWAVWLMAGTRKAKKWGFVAGVVGLVLSIFTFFLAQSSTAAASQRNEAVITVHSAALRIGADEASTELQLLHEGTKLQLLDEIGDWYKVKLSDETTGWMEKKAMIVI